MEQSPQACKIPDNLRFKPVSSYHLPPIVDTSLNNNSHSGDGNKFQILYSHFISIYISQNNIINQLNCNIKICTPTELPDIPPSPPSHFQPTQPHLNTNNQPNKRKTTKIPEVIIISDSDTDTEMEKTTIQPIKK